MKTGFSLVELIVVVAIAIIMTGIGAAAINGFIQSRKLETVTNELSTQIKLARNMALTSQSPNGGNANFSFVKVDIGGDFTVTATAINKNLTPNGLIYFSKKIDATSGLTITPLSFGFSTANGRLVASDGIFKTGSIPLNVGINGDVKQIIISELGLIDD
jgi:type II secretory pathway pseudopilin PulG